ncbi:MAG: FlgD immunoglobulin-like domain containing protein [Candidatus Eisenbacteria bacterium]
MFRRHQGPGQGVFTVLLFAVIIVTLAGNADTRGLQQRAVTADMAADVLTLFCPSDITLDCPFDIAPEYTGRPRITGGTPPYDTTYLDVGRECCCIDTFVRVWCVTDFVGTVDTCMQTIVFKDDVPPEITCPPDVDYECDSIGDFGYATATDNCDLNPRITHIDSVMFERCPWEAWGIRTWIATDYCGNADTCYQRISVQDSKTPVIVYCPPDTVVACDFNMAELSHAIAIDNCNPQLDMDYEVARLPGQAPCNYSIVRSWEFTDGCCNTIACQQRVTVREVPGAADAADDGIAIREVPEQSVAVVPAEIRVSCRPNPTDEGTAIMYSLPVQGSVTVDIYDIQGRRVISLVRDEKPAGSHAVDWTGSDSDGRPVTSGVYFCRVKIKDGPGILEKIIKM